METDMTQQCRICGGSTKKLFEKVVLGKYPANYVSCIACGMIFVANPHWLEEAYTDPINDHDIGLLRRNEKFANIVCRIIKKYFKINSKYLDYGGGYGIFVRTMRDRGYDFLWYDKFTINLFAKQFDAGSLNNQKFELITALEVFEHIENPKKLMQELFEVSDSIFITTEVPPSNLDELMNWHYLKPAYGQHIAFYTIQSMKTLASCFGKQYYTDNKQMHLFTNQKLKTNPLKSSRVARLVSKMIEKKIKSNSGIDLVKYDKNLINGHE